MWNDMTALFGGLLVLAAIFTVAALVADCFENKDRRFK